MKQTSWAFALNQICKDGSTDISWRCAQIFDRNGWTTWVVRMLSNVLATRHGDMLKTCWKKRKTETDETKALKQKTKKPSCHSCRHVVVTSQCLSLLSPFRSEIGQAGPFLLSHGFQAHLGPLNVHKTYAEMREPPGKESLNIVCSRTTFISKDMSSLESCAFGAFLNLSFGFMLRTCLWR